MQNIEINIHGFRFIEIETGYVAKPNRTAINRVPLSALKYSDFKVLACLTTIINNGHRSQMEALQTSVWATISHNSQILAIK